MSIERIIKNVEQLLVLHKSLNQIANNKTEMIVKGDTNLLQAIVKDENKHIVAIQKVNNDLLKVGKEYLLHNGISNTPTLSTIIEHAEKKDGDRLLQLKEELEKCISALRQRNEINQELIEQSLQFVHLSLDLLSPDIEVFNYGHSEQANEKKTHSIFDSKA